MHCYYASVIINYYYEWRKYIVILVEVNVCISGSKNFYQWNYIDIPVEVNGYIGGNCQSSTGAGILLQLVQLYYSSTPVIIKLCYSNTSFTPDTTVTIKCFYSYTTVKPVILQL